MQELTGTIADRYTILTRLGAGGMGDVYRATDTKLGRTVAVKRLRPDGSSPQQLRDRLLREAQTAAQVSHGGVAALYDVLDEPDDELLLVMEYVEGRTLRDRLSDHLSPFEAVDILCRCTEALRAAHDHGIVHYDLKPSNIMIQPDGGVKILDFGLAQIHSAIDPEQTTAVLASPATSGKIAGTPPYMSPEVLLGEPRDHRADLFSLGVVFYEMLTHRNPFMAATPSGITDRVLHLDPAPLSSVDPGIPTQLQPIISRMIAKRPAARYATTEALLTDLRQVAAEISRPSLPAAAGARSILAGKGRWLLALAAVAAAVMAAPYAIERAGSGTPAPPDLDPGGPATPAPAVLAVLPYGGLNADPELAARNDGMAAELANQLQRLTLTRGIQVLSPSALAIEEARTVEQARRLGATRCITFHLLRAGDRIRAILGLVDAANGLQLASDEVEVADGDHIALHEEVADRVLRMLKIDLGPLEGDAIAAGTDSSAALAFYETGLGYLQRPKTEANAGFAIQQFQQALRLDRAYAAAHAALGAAYHRMFDITGRPEWLDRAEGACRDAIDADELEPTGHGCLGVALRERGRYDESVAALRLALTRNLADVDTLRELGRTYEEMGRRDEAEALYLKAIDRAPNSPVAYEYLGALYAEERRNKEAIEAYERANDLAPDNFRTYANLGIAYYHDGDETGAIRALRRSIQLHPEYSTTYGVLGAVYLFRHEFEEAAEVLEKAVRFPDADYYTWGNLAEAYFQLPGAEQDAAEAFQRAAELAEQALQVNPADAETHGLLAQYLAGTGRRDAALEHLARALELGGESARLLRKAAQVHVLLGDHEAAIEALQRAVSGGYPAEELRNDAIFDPLRSDPRFDEILAAADR